MTLCRRLYEASVAKAGETRVDVLSIGLGYTAVATADGGLGLAYTAFDPTGSCSVLARDEEYEGLPASRLLEGLLSRDPLHRTMALALVNALNHRTAMDLPEDRGNDILFDLMGIGADSRVAMAGHFDPLMGKLKARGAEVVVVDIGRGIGCPVEFRKRLSDWADQLILTSTAILNDTADGVLEALGPGVRVAMLGPSTPLLAEAFTGLQVHFLAGTVPIDREAIFKAVRNGKGTPALQRFARKAYRVLEPSPAAHPA